VPDVPDRHCPRCNARIESYDLTWPIWIDGDVVDGGCQDCWETQCAGAWWEFVEQGGARIGVEGSEE
jgi:hypothetical protein